MVGQARGSQILSNPFFVAVLLTSTIFVVTVLAYLVSPYVLAPAAGAKPPGAGSVAMAVWFDHNGPLALGVEIGVIALAWLCAMWTDPWFSARARAREDRAGTRGGPTTSGGPTE